jgi:hypothetical protein
METNQSNQTQEQPSSPPLSQEPQAPPPHWFGGGSGDVTWGTLILLSCSFAIVYQTLRWARLDRSVAMFVGVPLLLGLFCANSRPNGGMGSALKYTTILLCVVSPVLGEGAVCVLMASPIIYLVVILSVLVGSWLIEKNRGVNAIAILPFLYAVWDARPPEKLPVVTISDSVEMAAPPEVVWETFANLALPLDQPLPFFLRAGFPGPEQILGEGLFVGAERRVIFENGTIVARVDAVNFPHSFHVKLSYEEIGHEFFNRWMILDEATFTLEALPGGRTRVTHQTSYRRMLSPGLYFAPLEEYGAHLLQQYLLEVCASYIKQRAS